MTPDIRPLGRKDAVHHRVAHGAVLPRGVVTDDAVPLRADPFDGALRLLALFAIAQEIGSGGARDRGGCHLERVRMVPNHKEPPDDVTLHNTSQVLPTAHASNGVRRAEF